MDKTGLSDDELIEMLQSTLKLTTPPEAANKHQWLRWQLIWMNDKLRLKRCMQEIAASRDVEKKLIGRKVMLLRQCELPTSVVTPVLNAATVVAHHEGKRMEIQRVVREALCDFLENDLNAGKFGLNSCQIKQLAASCISQRLQQMISKRSRRAVANDAEGKAALAHLHQDVLTAMRGEYGSQRGWRFPIYDMLGKLAESSSESPG